MKNSCFLIQNVTLIERTNPTILKSSEHIIFSVEFIGSGNSTKITTGQIISEIMDRLETICNEPCPFGFEFGKDFEKQNECDICKFWEKCYEANKICKR